MMQVERWTLLIVRQALLRGTTRFPDFQQALGVDPNLLAARLADLVSGGVMRLTTDVSRPEQSEYVLTAKGRALEGTITAFSTWSDDWSDAGLAVAAALPHADRHDIDPAPDPTIALTPALSLPATEPEVSESVVIEIAVLGSFALRVGGKPVGPLSVGSQRLLVFLALHDRAVGRAAMAGTMWPEATDERAGISLRSALSRLDAPTREAILVASAGLRLADTVVVDLRRAQALAKRLLEPGAQVRQADLAPEAIAALSSELLPDWYDDWVIAESEDWRQLRMNALEALARQLTREGRLAEAAGAARAAMKVEPLRESAHATLIRVHLAEGNQSEALRVFERYRALLGTALGLEPTPLLSRLVGGLNSSANI